jgi:peptidoglycan/LPS O-acetylase OafA/YrhL
VAFSWPRIGRPHESWPGITIAGIVILAAAVVADAFGDPPRGGPRLYVGLGLGAVVLVIGYALRRFERRGEGDRDAA